MSGSEGVSSVVRELALMLAKEIAGFVPDDISYVERVLGKDLRRALDEDPITAFLLLLEVFAGYVQHVSC